MSFRHRRDIRLIPPALLSSNEKPIYGHAGLKMTHSSCRGAYSFSPQDEMWGFLAGALSRRHKALILIGGMAAANVVFCEMTS